MITSKIKIKIEEVFGKDYKVFSEYDSFNPQNFVEGAICFRANHLYGALYITSINYEECEQLILCTPKFHYPFDRAGKYTFPPAHKILGYTKIDGSNIFYFQYSKNYEIFTSYKTRLRPFLSDASKFGLFVSMWKEMLKKYPSIPKLFIANEGLDIGGFGLELFGSLNKHLIEYDIPLDTNLLYAITKDGKILPLESLNTLDVPVTALENVITKDYVWNYEEIQKKMDSELQTTEYGFKGQEGQMWYCFLKTGEWEVFKCKGNQIQSIHFANGGIPKLIIKATAYNVLESESEVTVKALQELLLEEFTPEQVAASSIRAEKVVEEVNEELLFRRKVGDVLDSNLACTPIKNCPPIPDIMRTMSKHFTKGEMGAVYHQTLILLEKVMGKEKFDEYRNSGKTV